ncbi:MAG: hypothetical protein QM751_10195 [Paludibacteraceae bacterium]
MKKIYSLYILFCILFQVNAQKNQVEVYSVQTDSVLKGTIVYNSPDSITLKTDTSTFISFAKTELQGRDLAVSKEIKDLRKRLLKKNNNIKLPFADFPGTYQIKHGDKIKGYIMVGFACISIAGALVATPIWIAANGLSGLTLFFGIFVGVSTSVSIYAISTFWSKIDQYKATKKIINNRYYYIGTGLKF